MKKQALIEELEEILDTCPAEPLRYYEKPKEWYAIVVHLKCEISNLIARMEKDACPHLDGEGNCSRLSDSEVKQPCIQSPCGLEAEE